MQPAQNTGVPSWLTAVIAAVGLILGAIVTSSASVLSANRKVREVELTYRQRLQDVYLENARAYTNTVYVPIVMAIGTLYKAYDDFRRHSASDSSELPSITFRAEVGQFGRRIEELFERGAAAFLTTELERELEVFLQFVESSRVATRTTKRAVVSLGISRYVLTGETESEVLIRQFQIMRTMHQYLPLNFMRFNLAAERTVAAPISSKDFESEFTRAVQALRTLIKEVTLGAQARR